MARFLKVCFMLCIVLSGAMRLGQGQAEQPAVFLLTPQEAEQLRFTEATWEPIIRTRSLATGPYVVIQRPSMMDTTDGPLVKTASPTDFFINFEENQAPVDMGSLEIKAKKGIFSKSLTNRLKPYIKGTSLQAQHLNVPNGRFLIQVRISDTLGTETIETYRLQVQ